MHDTGSTSSHSGTSSHSDSSTSWHTGHTSHENHASPWSSPDPFYIRNPGDPNYYYGYGRRGSGGVSAVKAVVMAISILLPIILLIVLH